VVRNGSDEFVRSRLTICESKKIFLLASRESRTDSFAINKWYGLVISSYLWLN